MNETMRKICEAGMSYGFMALRSAKWYGEDRLQDKAESLHAGYYACCMAKDLIKDMAFPGDSYEDDPLYQKLNNRTSELYHEYEKVKGEIA